MSVQKTTKISIQCKVCGGKYQDKKSKKARHYDTKKHKKAEEEQKGAGINAVPKWRIEKAKTRNLGKTQSGPKDKGWRLGAHSNSEGAIKAREKRDALEGDELLDFRERGRLAKKKSRAYILKNHPDKMKTQNKLYSRRRRQKFKDEYRTPLLWEGDNPQDGPNLVFEDDEKEEKSDSDFNDSDSEFSDSDSEFSDSDSESESESEEEKKESSIIEFFIELNKSKPKNKQTKSSTYEQYIKKINNIFPPNDPEDVFEFRQNIKKSKKVIKILKKRKAAKSTTMATYSAFLVASRAMDDKVSEKKFQKLFNELKTVVKKKKKK